MRIWNHTPDFCSNEDVGKNESIQHSADMAEAKLITAPQESQSEIRNERKWMKMDEEKLEIIEMRQQLLGQNLPGTLSLQGPKTFLD